MHLRSILRAFSLASLVAVAGCESTLEPADRGEIVATWAGERFQGTAGAYVSGSALDIVGSDLENGVDGWSVFIRIDDFSGPGSYDLDAGEAEVGWVTGGDAIGDIYRTTTAGAGRLTIGLAGDGRLVGTVRFDAEPSPGGRAPVGSRARFEGSFDATLQ